jgi:acetate kinase
VTLDEQSNLDNSQLISTTSSRVAVRVIPTDEEVMIANAVSHFLGFHLNKETK